MTNSPAQGLSSHETPLRLVPQPGSQPAGASLRLLSRIDALANRIYGSRFNPLYQSGVIASFLFVVLLVTGIYLLLFYRIGDPHGSIAHITEQVWTGRWIRALHRYASAALVVAVVVHAARMLLQRRSWGPRLLAWFSGLVLVGVVLVAGWTGYVMVWDEHGHVVAVQGARLLDVLPLFPEPLIRTFAGAEALPPAFFFLNLFLHIVLPVGMALVLWLHVSRLARPALVPPKGLAVAVLILLVGASIAWPLPVWPEANLLTLPGTVPLDLFYNFWIPVLAPLPAWVGWVAIGGAVAAFSVVPLVQRPPSEDAPGPSTVDERLCTGCEQCVQDCPYDAIQMVARADGRAGLVARVDPALCVSCGICAGSCAPMGVGPPGRTGRDQLAELRASLEQEPLAPGDPVVVACSRGSGGVALRSPFDAVRTVQVDCAGNLHTSVIELLLRDGAGGVLVAACHPRDCWNREGAIWLEARMYDDREAELQSRVDRRRVELVAAGISEHREVLQALQALRARVDALDLGRGSDASALGADCRSGSGELGTDAGPGVAARAGGAP